MFMPEEKTPLAVLLEMLSFARPADSAMEKKWVEDYIYPVVMAHKPLTYTDEKNVGCTVGEGSKVLFSCHTDTVHRTEMRLPLLVDAATNIVYADKMVLGADDGAGVWLMLEMIKAGVPGTYLFHRGEECGGLGSSAMADQFPDYLKGHDFAIAFDRKADCSVITHQAGGRCCSDEFADQLCGLLGGNFGKDTGGSFTDTANYTHLIAECTNLSVGYYDQHTANEFLDLEFLLELREKCIALPWHELKAHRVPAKPVVVSYRRSKGWKPWKNNDNSFGLYGSGWETDYDSDWWNTDNTKTEKKPNKSYEKKLDIAALVKSRDYLAYTDSQILDLNYGDLADLISEDPYWAADVLQAALAKTHKE